MYVLEWIALVLAGVFAFDILLNIFLAENKLAELIRYSHKCLFKHIITLFVVHSWCFFLYFCVQVLEYH